MKKGIPESNPVLALWQRVILDGCVHELAREFREKLKMPLDGFHPPSDYKIWYKKHHKDSNTEILFSNFVKESKKIIPYKGVIDDTHLDMILINLICNNNTDYDYLNSIKNSGMDIKIIKDSKIFNPRTKEYAEDIKDGVYIKLKPFSTIDSILKYVENNKILIRKSLKEFNESSNLKKPKKNKISSNFERDSTILIIDEWSKKEIERNFNIKADYKDMAISLLMRGMGEKVTSSIVKSVKQRRKIK